MEKLKKLYDEAISKANEQGEPIDDIAWLKARHDEGYDFVTLIRFVLTGYMSDEESYMLVLINSLVEE